MNFPPFSVRTLERGFDGEGVKRYALCVMRIERGFNGLNGLARIKSYALRVKRYGLSVMRPQPSLQPFQPNLC